VSLCRSKTSSSDKCLECPQQQPSKLAWRPHRTGSVASTFDADRPLRDATQPNKNWKISTHPNPWVNLTHGQLWYKHAPVAIQPASPSQTAPRLWSHAQPNSVTFFNVQLIGTCPPIWGIWTQCITWFLGPTRVCRSGISIGSAVLAGLRGRSHIINRTRGSRSRGRVTDFVILCYNRGGGYLRQCYIQSVKWRHRIYGQDTIAILWV